MILKGHRWPLTVPRTQPGVAPAGVLREPAKIQVNEKHTSCAVAFSGGAAAACPGRPAAGGARPALRSRVLLQGAMGASAGIPAALSEEPLPVAPEARRKWPHDLGEDRAAFQPHDRGCALGLSRHDSVQELDHGDHGQSRRRPPDQATLAGPERLTSARSSGGSRSYWPTGTYR